ncbi:MAG TPA: hypothetical protein PKE04_08255, partial [Clostridia bacterium]|nr:hypothetical protein [Clostridia bacterium]
MGNAGSTRILRLNLLYSEITKDAAARCLRCPRVLGQEAIEMNAYRELWSSEQRYQAAMQENIPQ